MTFIYNCLEYTFNVVLFYVASQNDTSDDTNDDVQLDEECAKVFAMDIDNDKFDLDKFHDTGNSSEPRQYTEKEFSCKYRSSI